jgi:hypothetical protein
MRKYHAQLAKAGRKPGPEPKLDPNEVKALRKQGLLIREIMAKVGASKASVYWGAARSVRAVRKRGPYRPGSLFSPLAEP